MTEQETQMYFEDYVMVAWKKLKHWIDDILTGHISEEDREWDEFLDRLVAVRYGKAPITDGGWVPCEYKQPPRCGTYLTTTKRGAVRTNHWYGESWGHKDAVAWRPLPEPWEGVTTNI